jgi:hypothetical protein
MKGALMRALVAAAAVVVFAVPAAAQTTASQDPSFWPSPLRDAFAHINVGGQAQGNDFTERGVFPLYLEEASFEAAHSVGGGAFFDIGGGVRVWEDLSVGFTYARRATQTDAAQLTAGVPDLVFTDVVRAASGEAPGLKHHQQAVHLHAYWRIPITEEFDIALVAGPSFFTVKQDSIESVEFSEVGGDFSRVNLTGSRITRHRKSAAGINLGVDGTYMFTRYVGGGVLLRFSRASVNLPVAGGSAGIDAGGFDAAVGLRLRFR